MSGVVYPKNYNPRYRSMMSERSYATLPRNFTFQPMPGTPVAQVTPVPLRRRLSIASLNGEQGLVYGMQRFGSVPANLQTMPKVMSVPAFAGQYPYTPTRPSSQFAYHMPSRPVVPVSGPIARGRRPNAFYSTPSPNGSESLYSTSQITPRSYAIPSNYTVGSRKLNGAYNGNSLSSSNNDNKVTKIQLANKLELEEITLRKKSENDFIGLIVEVLPESLDQDVIIVVNRIISGGLCHKDGNLKRGDRILKVNGHRAKDLETTTEIFRQPNITLTIARATVQFKRDHLRVISCNPFGHKPLPKGTKKLTPFNQGIPRMAKGVNETKLEVEMISLCCRLERVRTGSKRARWHLYNIDKEEYMSMNNDNKSIKNHQKKVTKLQATKKNTSKNIDESQMKMLDKPLSKQPSKSKGNKMHNTKQPNNQMPTYRPQVRMMQPYPYWVPVSQPVHPMMPRMNHATMSYPSFQNGGVYPQQFGNRTNSLPNSTKQASENGSWRGSQNKIRRSSTYEETLL